MGNLLSVFFLTFFKKSPGVFLFFPFLLFLFPNFFEK